MLSNTPTQISSLPPVQSLDVSLRSQNKLAEIVDPIRPEFLNLLDSDFIEYYNNNIGIKPPTHQVDFAEIRKNPTKWAGLSAKDYSLEPFVKTLDLISSDGSIFKVRTYHPDVQKFGDGPYPVQINFHGGGFCFGDLTSDAKWCMMIRNEVGMVVVDVDYRLTPENKYGKCFEDAWATLLWVRENAINLNINQNSVSISGISAGGTICCQLQHMARDAGIPLALAILAVPGTADYVPLAQPSDSPFSSFITNAMAPCLNWERINFFKRQGFPAGEPPSDLPSMWAAPLKKDNFADLCPTFIATAGCDPLCDEGEAYGRKVAEHGGLVQFRRYTRVPHPFMHMPIKKALLYDQDTRNALRAAHSL